MEGGGYLFMTVLKLHQYLEKCRHNKEIQIFHEYVEQARRPSCS
jgi:hypothetical protein